MDSRFFGVPLIAIGIAIAASTFLLSGGLLETIDMGDSCSSVSTCPHVTVLNLSYLGYIASTGLIISGFLIVLFLPPSKTKPRKIPRGLHPDEKGIYKLLLDSGGTIFQSEIVENTSFPKARVTRILDRLESQDLLERRRRGMTNVVVLK